MPNILSGDIKLPRPMMHSKDFDFSFSGLKTAVLYTIRDLEHIDDSIHMNIAHEFEQSVTDVILYKLQKVLEHKEYKSLIVSGGVIANTHLRSQIEQFSIKQDIPLLFPKIHDSTDNAQMIAVAGAIESLTQAPRINLELKAQGYLEY
jgi:N6-L-threonylcarbamoyladenine synthase